MFMTGHTERKEVSQSSLYKEEMAICPVLEEIWVVKLLCIILAYSFTIDNWILLSSLDYKIMEHREN